MRMYQIEVDEEVYAFLKARAEPLVDTANSVLRRVLLDGRSKEKAFQKRLGATGQFPDLPRDLPKALRQTF